MTFEELKKSLQELLGKGDFKIEYNRTLLADSWNKNTADVVISTLDEEKSDFAVLVSTNSSANDGINLTYAKKIVRRMTYDYSFWIGLVWDRKERNLWVLDPSFGQWKKIELNEVAVYAKEFLASGIEGDYKRDLLNNLEKYSTSSKVETETVAIIRDWVESLEEKSFQQRNRLVTVDKEAEYRLLRNLSTIDKKGVRFCRYISMEGLQRILLNKKESMCGLAGMNDKSEGFFLDKCLNDSSFNLFRKPQKQIDEFNNAFILSLCVESKKDDLTMWRLYGRDGFGACLVYEADFHEIDTSKDFILLPIIYGNASNKIVLLFKILSKLPYIKGLKFGLYHKKYWQFFVKPDEFKVEKEYRLLYIPTDIKQADVKWIYNGGCSIFHPLCEFSSRLFPAKDEKAKVNGNTNSFPLILKEVILGPKCIESKTNKVQLRTYLSQATPYPLILSESNIDFYR